MKRITDPEELIKILEKNDIKLNSGQLEWFEEVERGREEFLPFKTTESYLDAALSAEGKGREAILKQIIPDSREFVASPCELDDPLGEQKYSPFPRFVHRYPDRALILMTDCCAMFCRHCFRRSFSGGSKGPLTDDQLLPILEYLQDRAEIKEILLTGGDPLTIPDRRLKSILIKIKTARPDMIIRICSRMPVVDPDRISSDFTGMLAQFDGIWFVTHFNNAAELTSLACSALRRLVKAGIPVLNQTVLLRGVNDSIIQLAELFNRLLQNSVKPYYLFQGDLAAGTSHLRVPLTEALELTAELKNRVSGMAMPRFAVDLPGGGGKITLPSQSHPVKLDGEYYIIQGLDNEEYRYPAN